MTNKERLEELYIAAFNADDINLCLEIADRLKVLAPAVGVDGGLVQQFIEALDELLHCSENGHEIIPHRFDYCLRTFEVKLIE